MRYPACEKLEIIRLVEGSHLLIRRTLDKLGIPRTTLYHWYDRYLSVGPEAQQLNASIRKNGISFGRASEAARAVQWQQMALASEAVLQALDHYIAGGGGSRGARAICDPDGGSLPQSVHGPLTDYRFRAERDEDKHHQLLLRLTKDGFEMTTRPNQPFDETAKSFFERDWPAWLTGGIYDLADGGDERW